MAKEVRNRLVARLEKKALPMDIVCAAREDWWVSLYASWLAMYAERQEQGK